MPVEFNATVNLDLDAMGRELDPKQIAAVMEGVAQVLTANPYSEESSPVESLPAPPIHKVEEGEE